MLIYNEIQKLKALNAQAINDLKEIKTTIAQDLQDAILQNIDAQNQEKLMSALNDLIAQNKITFAGQSTDAITKATTTLATQQEEQFSRLFEKEVKNLATELEVSLEHLHKKSSQEFIASNKEATRELLNDSIATLSAEIKKEAIANITAQTEQKLNEIIQDTTNATTQMLDGQKARIQQYCEEASKKNLQTQIQAQLALNENLLEIHKMRFQSALFLSAISLSRELSLLGIKPITQRVESSTQDSTNASQSTAAMYINKSYAVR